MSSGTGFSMFAGRTAGQTKDANALATAATPAKATTGATAAPSPMSDFGDYNDDYAFDDGFMGGSFGDFGDEEGDEVVENNKADSTKPFFSRFTGKTTAAAEPTVGEATTEPPAKETPHNEAEPVMVAKDTSPPPPKAARFSFLNKTTTATPSTDALLVSTPAPGPPARLVPPPIVAPPQPTVAGPPCPPPSSTTTTNPMTESTQTIATTPGVLRRTAVTPGPSTAKAVRFREPLQEEWTPDDDDGDNDTQEPHKADHATCPTDMSEEYDFEADYYQLLANLNASRLTHDTVTSSILHAATSISMAYAQWLLTQAAMTDRCDEMEAALDGVDDLIHECMAE